MIGLIVGGLAVATALFVGVMYLLLRLLYVPVNHVAFVESWTGKLRMESRTGLHLLSLFEWVVYFPLTWLGGKGQGDKRLYHIVPTTPIRIDPPEWPIVSEDKERMSIDLWMTMQIVEPRRFLVETSADDPAAVLMDQVRMQVIEQCKKFTAKALIASPYPKFDLEDIQKHFGVLIAVHIESLKRANDIETQQAAATKAEIDRETRHAVAMQEARRVAEIELQRMTIETERSKREQEMRLAQLNHQAAVDAKRREAEMAAAQHARELDATKQKSKWADLAAASQAGLTPEQYVELERIRALSAMSTDKVAYLPSSAHPYMQLLQKE